MKTRNIAGQLLLGSKNIDRMKSEIAWTINMLIGYALSCGHNMPKHVTRTACSSLSNYRWTINSIDRNTLVVKCSVHQPLEGEEIWKEIYSSTENNHRRIKTEDAQGIHSSLDDLVELMIEVFPCIDTRWKPLIDASEVVFPANS
jgi:hypothetical protein